MSGCKMKGRKRKEDAGIVERMGGRVGKTPNGETRHTCSNDFFNLHEWDVNLLGKLADSLVGVLISEGVNIDLHPWRALSWERQEGQQQGEKTSWYLGKGLWKHLTSLWYLLTSLQVNYNAISLSSATPLSLYLILHPSSPNPTHLLLLFCPPLSFLLLLSW